MSNEVIDLFEKTYGKKAEVLARAPGRLEILGNHTDYNEGIVLSCAVGQATELALAPVDGKTCSLVSSMNGVVVEFDLDNIDTAIKGDWTNYIKGVIVELRKRNIEVPAFVAAVHSTVPLSAGMSSSAALEVSAGFAFAEAFCIDLPKADWAKIGQGVENNYMGLGSGLLDQFSSIFGKENSLIYCDFRTNEVIKNVDVPAGYELVVANSMVEHDLVESDYNVRRQSCMNVAEQIKAQFPEVKALRDVTPAMLEAAKDLFDFTDYLRAKHVVGECDRVEQAVVALEAKDVDAFGKLLYQSHKSSEDNFANSCPELDTLVELSTSISGCKGARLSGGGFGGISIHLVEEDKAEDYCTKIKAAYKLQTGKDIQTIICKMGAGATVEKL